MQTNSEEFWDYIAKKWEKNGHIRDRSSEFVEAAKYIKGNVLEVGFGTGSFCKYIPNVQYMGMDISQGMVDNARINYPDHLFLKVDLEKLPSKQWQDAFGTVVCFQTLEHFHEPDLIKVMDKLKIISRYQLIFSVPNGIPTDTYRKANGHWMDWADSEVCKKFFSGWGVVELIPCNDNHIAGVVTWTK